LVRYWFNWSNLPIKNGTPGLSFWNLQQLFGIPLQEFESQKTAGITGFHSDRG
jgi:hypothetical protein